MENSQKYLRILDASKYIGIAKSTFWLWVRQGKLPQGFLLSPRCRVWSVEELEKFMQEQKEKGA